MGCRFEDKEKLLKDFEFLRQMNDTFTPHVHELVRAAEKLRQDISFTEQLMIDKFKNIDFRLHALMLMYFA